MALLGRAEEPAAAPQTRDEQLVKALAYGTLPPERALGLLEEVRERHPEKLSEYEEADREGADVGNLPEEDELETAMSAANAERGPRVVPQRVIPLPSTVSPQMRAVIEMPYRSPAWNLRPRSADEWRRAVAELAKPRIDDLPRLRQSFGVTSEPATFGGVPGWWVRPDARVRPERRVLHLHSGGYVYWGGEAATSEAILMAGIGGFEVASIDYRLAFDAPYPAALDDALAAWQELLTQRPAEEMAVFGSSTGGALTLALVLRAKQEGVPLPGAIGAGTPWSDLAEVGDSYKTNEWLDGVEVSYRGFLARAAALYADGRDMTDPLLSPVYGDFAGAPPAILISGTRDLFLSNTVRVHRAMRQAGVDAQLHVFEGQSHAQYLHAHDSPETRDVFGEMATFFKAHTTTPTV